SKRISIERFLVEYLKLAVLKKNYSTIEYFINLSLLPKIKFGLPEYSRNRFLFTIFPSFQNQVEQPYRNIIEGILQDMERREQTFDHFSSQIYLSFLESQLISLPDEGLWTIPGYNTKVDSLHSFAII